MYKSVSGKYTTEPYFTMIAYHALFLVVFCTVPVFGKPGYLTPCWNHKNCPDHLVCRSFVDYDLKKDLRCRSKISTGGKCRKSDHCVKDNICSLLRSPLGKHAVCHKPSIKGQICSSNWHCAEKLVCRPNGGQLFCMDKGEVGAVCDTKEDCASKLICRKKYITDMQTKCLNAGKLGEPCANSKQCTKGLMCREVSVENSSMKKCLKKSSKGGFCKANEDCEKHLHCRGHKKEPKLICADRKADIGDYCVPWEWWHCRSSGADICRRLQPGQMNTCQKYAKNAEFCEQDWHCDSNMKCKLDQSGRGKCEYRNKKGDRCEWEGDCPSWLTCRAPGPTKLSSNEYCLEPLSLRKPCKNDKACASGVCLKRSINEGKMCRNKLPLKSVCDRPEHCLDGLSCRKMYPDSENMHCLAKLGVGSACIQNSDCKEKHSCRDKKCFRTGTEYGKFCASSKECKGSLVCMNNKCMLCRQKYECPAKHVCSNFKCVKK